MGYIKIIPARKLSDKTGEPHISGQIKYLRALQKVVFCGICVRAIFLGYLATDFHIAEVGHQIPCP